MAKDLYRVNARMGGVAERPLLFMVRSFALDDGQLKTFNQKKDG